MVGAGVVIAAAFCGMCLPWNPAASTPIRAATTSTTASMMAIRFPRPSSVLLTITSIAGSLSMDRRRYMDCADAVGKLAAGNHLHLPSSGAERGRILAEELLHCQGRDCREHSTR